MKLIKNMSIFVIILALSVFGYLQALSFSAGLPYPEFMNSQLKSGLKLSPLHYWGFVALTLSVPYAIGIAIVSFVGGRFSEWWLPASAVALALFYIYNLAYSPLYWLSLFLLSVLVSVSFSALGVKLRNKSLGSIGE